MVHNFGLRMTIVDSPRSPVLPHAPPVIYEQMTLPSRFRKIEGRQIYAQGERWEYLDLATANSAGPRWERRTMNRIAKGQPPMFRECLLEASTAPRYGLLHNLYHSYFFEIQNFADRHPYLQTFYETCETWHMEETMRITSRVRLGDVQAEMEQRRADREKRKSLLRSFIVVCFRFLQHPVTKFGYALATCTEDALNDSEFTIEVVGMFFGLRYLRRYLVGFVESNYDLECLLRHAKDVGFDFWGVQREANEEYCSEFNYVVDCMSSVEQHEMARILLKYGFRYSCRTAVYETQCRTFQHKRYNNILIGVPHGLHLMREIRRRNRLNMMLSVDTLHCFDLSVSDLVRSQRQLTLVHLTKTLTEPYVTPKELYDNLEGVVCEEFKPDLAEMSKQYAESGIFGGNHLIRQPRSVADLCRCRILNALADKLKLPEGIKELGMPNRIVEFLELKT